MRGFKVYLPSNSDNIPLWTDEAYPYTVEGMVEDVLIDEVFYSDNVDIGIEEVEHSLIYHDHYPPDIWVEEY